MPSLNGLVDINADSVNSLSISSDEISSQNVNTKTLFVDGTNLGTIVNLNAQKLTAISYSATPTPTTFVSSNLDVSQNLYVSKSSTSQTSSIDLKGTMYIRDPTDPSVVYMKVAYDPAIFGFAFQMEVPGRIMYFRVKTNTGGYKNLYFSVGQVYTDILTYVDNTLIVSHNNQIVLGDGNNSGVWNGASINTYLILLKHQVWYSETEHLTTRHQYISQILPTII